MVIAIFLESVKGKKEDFKAFAPTIPKRAKEITTTLTAT
jgi:hypothetical protein